MEGLRPDGNVTLLSCEAIDQDRVENGDFAEKPALILEKGRKSLADYQAEQAAQRFA